MRRTLYASTLNLKFLVTLSLITLLTLVYYSVELVKNFNQAVAASNLAIVRTQLPITTQPIQAPVVTTPATVRQPPAIRRVSATNKKAPTALPVRTSRQVHGPPKDAVAAYGHIVSRFALQHNLPPALIYAVIFTESGFNPNARSSANALGLMQIKPATARSVGLSGATSRLYEPEVNIQYGTAYLAQAYAKSGGDICRTVSLYNRGLYSKQLSPAYCGKVRKHMARYGSA